MWRASQSIHGNGWYQGHKGWSRKDGGRSKLQLVWTERDNENRVEDFLSSVDQWTQDLCKGLNEKIEETQLGLKTVTTSLTVGTKDLHEQLNL